MYDIEVAHPKHNFVLPNGVITSNSHAVSYAAVAYACAYLKHYFPLEWWTAVLRNADRNEIDEKFWKYCWRKILMPDIKKSGALFTIEGDMIRAPLSFIHGVGMAAHTELTMGLPYTDIQDFTAKIHARRVATGKETVDKKGQPKLKLGHSALHRGIVSSLIVSRSMDSLFPESSDVYEKLRLYEEALAAASGKKTAPLSKKFLNMNQIDRYQMCKSVLPAYVEPLLPMLLARKVPGVSYEEQNDSFYYRADAELYRFVNFAQLERLTAMPMLPQGGITVAAAVYITEDRRFKYQGTKTAAELSIDLDGGRFRVVKWPGKNGKLPSDFPEDLTGSIAILVLTRWNEKKPDFSVDQAIVVQPSLSLAEEEESP
jgi:hypothetical protein